MSYTQEAILKCQNLYARGLPHTQIEAEMRKEFPTWSRKLLYGEGGWIDRYGFEDARRRYEERTRAFEQAAEDTAHEMIGELSKIRKNLYEDLKLDPGNHSKIFAHEKVCNALIRLLRTSEQQVEPVNIDDNQLWQILNSIPEMKAAIEANKAQILKAIEASA